MGHFISKYSFTEFNDVVPIDYTEDIDHLFIDAFSEEYGGLFKIQMLKIHNWDEILEKMVKIMEQYNENMCPIEFHKKSDKIKVKVLDPVFLTRKQSKSHNHHRYYTAFGVYLTDIKYEIGRH